jgi:hypothetical protein
MSSEEEKNKAIPILYRHLFRDPLESDKQEVAFQIPFETIRDVITKNEIAQAMSDYKRRRESHGLDAQEEDRLNLDRLLKRRRQM